MISQAELTWIKAELRRPGITHEEAVSLLALLPPTPLPEDDYEEPEDEP